MAESQGAKEGQQQGSRVCVAVRCRPLNDREVQAGGVQAVETPGNAQLVLRHKNEDHPFVFDHVFGPDVQQEHVFQTIGVPQLDQSFEGYNSTIFAYGQTGSGKTHTMMSHRAKDSDRGLIPRISDGLFQRVADLTSKHEGRRFLVQCSFLEIYNEVIYDLLAPKRKDSKGGGLEVKEQKGIGVYVKDLTETVVEGPDKLAQLIEEGMAQRATAATRMNESSSRSHCVFTIRLHQKDAADSSQNTISKLNLVDLAGSERAKDTGAEGVLLKEGANINKSLSALGNVINALSNMAESGKRRAFVPYRDSKLTRVLQESLGGNAFCTMLAAVSPAAVNAEETLSTLNYAKRAKSIKVAATRNEESSHIQQLEREVEALRQKLALETAGGSREAKELEERHRQELETLQSFMKQSWEDKQKLSEELEVKRQHAKQEAERIAEQLRLERRRRLQMLEQGDLQLSIQAVSEIGGRLCAGWPERISAALKAYQQLQSQLRAVALYRESAGADLAALWERCSEGGTGEGFREGESALASTLLAQVRVKLLSMSGELDSLLQLEAHLKDQLGQIAPEVSVALCNAREEAAALSKQQERSSEEDAAKEELPELIALVQRQLQRHCAQEHARLEADAQRLLLREDLHRLAKCVQLEAATPGEAAALPSALRAAAEASSDSTDLGVPAAEATPAPEGVLLGLASGDDQVAASRLAASSNADAAACARLLRTSGFAGWTPARDRLGEFLEVDLRPAAGEQQLAVAGLSLQGREPCSGHWAQTHELLRLALLGDAGASGEEFAFLHVADKTYARPPVRLVHEASLALVHYRGCFGTGEGAWALPPEFLTYSSMSREHKIDFFEELIRRTNGAWEKVGPGVVAKLTAADILGGKRCEETNRLLQMLSYLSLGLPDDDGDECGLGGLVDARPQWVTAWKLQYLAEDGVWHWYAANGQVAGASEEEALVLDGNVDAQTVKYVSMPRPLLGSRIRVHPVKWFRHPGLRCEVHLAPASAASGAGGGSSPSSAKTPRSASSQLKAGVGLAVQAVAALQAALDERLRARSRREDDLKEQAAQERGDLERRLQEALQRAEASEARASAAEAALLASRADQERLSAAARQLQADIAVATEARASAESKAMEKEKECAELQEKVADLTEQLIVMTDARDALRAHEEDLAEAIAAKDEELVRAHRSYVDLTQRLEEKELEEDTADLLASEMSKMSQQVVELQEANSKLLRENARLREDMDGGGHAPREVARLREEVVRLEAANQSLVQERDKLARKKEKLEAKKAELVEKLQISEKARQLGRERVMSMLEKKSHAGEYAMRSLLDGEGNSPGSMMDRTFRSTGGTSGGNSQNSTTVDDRSPVYEDHAGHRGSQSAYVKVPSFSGHDVGQQDANAGRPTTAGPSFGGTGAGQGEARRPQSPAFGRGGGGGANAGGRVWDTGGSGGAAAAPQEAASPAVPATPAKRSKAPALAKDASAPVLRSDRPKSATRHDR